MVVFLIAALVALAATLMAVTRLHPVEALLYLIVSLLAVAVVFYQLGAPFVAALEIVIYAGAIMVLFVFVMMLLNLGIRTTDQERQWLRPGMFAGPVLLALVLGGGLLFLLSGGAASALPAGEVGARQVAARLYTVYPLAVELGAFLLLAGLVGAYHLGRDERPSRLGTGREELERRIVPQREEKVP